jgi:hypothetical protein
MFKSLFILSAGLLFACGAKSGSKAQPVQSLVGWHQAEGMMGACYYPPDFEKIGVDQGLTGRKMARSEAMDAMMSQWSGQREDGISFSKRLVEDVETVLLGHANDIETVALKNLTYCQTAMNPASTSSGWKGWLKRLPNELTAGECLTPIRDRLFHYLELGQAWYWELPICGGNRVKITATRTDRYRISDTGPWITVEGEQDASTVLDSSFPCNESGCVAGQLVGKFTGAAGYTELFPIGAATTFKAPMDGTLSIGLNDATFYDNKWYSSGGVVDHAGIEIAPVD